MRGRNAALRNASRARYENENGNGNGNENQKPKKKGLLTSRSGAQSLKPISNIIEKITTILNTLL